MIKEAMLATTALATAAATTATALTTTAATGALLFELMVGCWVSTGTRTSLLTGEITPLQGTTKAWVETTFDNTSPAGTAIQGPVLTLISASRWEDPTLARAISTAYWMRENSSPGVFEMGYIRPDTTRGPKAGEGIFTPAATTSAPDPTQILARFVSEQTLGGTPPYYNHSETTFEKDGPHYIDTLSHGDLPLARTELRFKRVECAK